ncbi:hypothetical protein [Amycolatopsis sp. lyj-346]|uniref:hypothetical protein n=1 Tax=Amycolatopsis sp. lyj-346 TaxID=2789289 RepID=UPI0039791817
MTSVWLRYLTGADIDALGVTDADIVGAVEDVLADHGRGQVVFEPRTHLVPDNGGKGHFNILRGHLSAMQVSGVKVVGDFVGNFERATTDIAVANLILARAEASGVGTRLPYR